jgi:hypothetical protein
MSIIGVKIESDSWKALFLYQWTSVMVLLSSNITVYGISFGVSDI